MQEGIRGSHLPHPPPLKVTENEEHEQSKGRTWPKIDEMHMKTNFSKPGCLYLPIHGKVLNP